MTGYFTPDAIGATYHALTPTRLLDTPGGTDSPARSGVRAARTFAVTGRTMPG